MSAPKTVVLAAGGTGGHLFPAFALAEELGRRGLVVDLATDMRGDRYGSGFPARTIYQIPSATVRGRSPVALAKTGLQLARGIGSAYRILGRVKPAAVIGFGGYPTFPPLMAARLRGIATAVHEQNAVLGRANRLLASRVDCIATTFSETKFLSNAVRARICKTGNPVRAAVETAAEAAYPELRDETPFHIVVFGGSQGARFLSESVPGALKGLPHPLRQRLHIVQQAREEDVPNVKKLYQDARLKAEVGSFFQNLPELIAKSHLVIARAGASTVAELTVIGRPAVLIPLPGALDNDQLENAKRLAESGAAWCIEQKDVTAARLTDEIARLAAAPNQLADAARQAKSMASGNAAIALADVVEEMIVDHR